jgi:hypothetical protein
MAGGVMQLVAVGAQDQFITGAPEISYFKMVYKRHTNFSMESVRQTFNTKPVLETSRNVFTCRINRVADLLQEIYMSFTLPNIYSSDKFRFRWIENIAQYLIYSCSVRIDTQLIDQLWGEWMDVWNELSLSNDKKDTYDRMTGNVEEFNNPRLLDPYVMIDNNNINYSFYPAGNTLENPSIKGRRFFIPLQFWFTKNPGLALPLVALQYQEIDITIELRAMNELYQVYDIESGLYISPSEYAGRHLNLNIGKFNQDYDSFGVPNHDVSLQRFMVPVDADYSFMPGSVDIDAYMECNYVFLDESERKVIALQSNDYLIERVYRIEREGVLAQGTIDLILQNPVKELVWITRRGDATKYNSWNNFTNSLVKLPNYQILNTAKLLWNGMERMEDKPAEYYNYIQPFQYHTRSPKEGIYCYSFALYPEKPQPSGSFNASKINKIQMYVTTNPPLENYDYEFIIYAVYYNVFRVMSGSGGMVFAN